MSSEYFAPHGVDLHDGSRVTVYPARSGTTNLDCQIESLTPVDLRCQFALAGALFEDLDFFTKSLLPHPPSQPTPVQSPMVPERLPIGSALSIGLGAYEEARRKTSRV